MKILTIIASLVGISIAAIVEEENATLSIFIFLVSLGALLLGSTMDEDKRKDITKS